MFYKCAIFYTGFPWIYYRFSIDFPMVFYWPNHWGEGKNPKGGTHALVLLNMMHLMFSLSIFM